MQWRSIYVVPPTEEELGAFIEKLGFEGENVEQSREIATRVMILGTIRRVADRSSVGTVVLAPHAPDGSSWEYSIEISEAKHRDAFAAVNASDIMAHYIFDHVGADEVVFRVEASNRAAAAIALRIGYHPSARIETEEGPLIHYVLDQATWQRRRERIEGRETTHGRSRFLRLEPPYVPLALPSAP